MKLKEKLKLALLPCCTSILLLSSSCGDLFSNAEAEAVAPASEEVSRVITVAETEAVDDGYFSGCAFIGHSIIRGFQLYSGIADGDFYAVNGITTTGLMEYSGFTLPDGGKGTLEDALSQTQYHALYIMLGINEISSDPEEFRTALTQLAEAAHAYQQDAVIYLISVTPTTRNLSEQTTFSRENIMAFNDVLLQIASEQSCYYLDLFTLFSDTDGYLPDDYSWDGLHLAAEQYTAFYEFLKTHTVEESL